MFGSMAFKLGMLAKKATGGGGSAFTESSTAPANPNPGDRWYHTDDGIIYTSVTKNGSQVWIS